ncbi:hypothetical protein B005_4121 [Nocardiopsis alba ATCC BAA-2165]|uniref:Uncharacterized protein n=1 Tax=Nocardiopsis alba (strain ATCC BAA-2165 / BE74) TaxID=1205910 RepID=J7L7M9_NOCAA|nr:hypothetical protein B005_4121 [Nocardiopsis alba ATCC BAA-2165]
MSTSGEGDEAPGARLRTITWFKRRDTAVKEEISPAGGP